MFDSGLNAGENLTIKGQPSSAKSVSAVRSSVVKATAVKPVLQAILVAERVYQTDDGKAIITAVFNGIEVSKEPIVQVDRDQQGNNRTLVRGGISGSPDAYISLTDVCDDTVLHLQFVSLTRNLVLFQQVIKVTSNDRLNVVEIVVRLPPLPILDKEGVYAFEVVCEGEIIGSHRIVARERKQ